jgi:hypothetical protein
MLFYVLYPLFEVRKLKNKDIVRPSVIKKNSQSARKDMFFLPSAIEDVGHLGGVFTRFACYGTYAIN